MDFLSFHTHWVLLVFPSHFFIRAGPFHVLHKQTQQQQQQLWNPHTAESPCAIQVFIPDQEQEKMEEHFLCTSPGLSKQLLCLPALATFMTGIFRWCQRDPKATNCSGKKFKKKKYEWKRGPQRQNRLLYFAIMLRPTQEIHGTGPLLEALPEG